MGKWSHLVGHMTPLPEDATRSDAFIVKRSVYQGVVLNELTECYNAVANKKAEVNAQLSELNLELDVLESLILQSLEAQNMDSTVMNGYTWTRSPEPYPNISDREAVRRWAEVEAPEMLTVNTNALKALTKARLEDGDVPPPGVTVFLKETISRRRKA